MDGAAGFDCFKQALDVGGQVNDLPVNKRMEADSTFSFRGCRERSAYLSAYSHCWFFGVLRGDLCGAGLVVGPPTTLPGLDWAERAGVVVWAAFLCCRTGCGCPLRA